jgi:hypothetical protein
MARQRAKRVVLKCVKKRSCHKLKTFVRTALGKSVSVHGSSSSVSREVLYYAGAYSF